MANFLVRHCRAFLDQRVAFATLREFFHKQLHKRLPPHTGWAHVFGSLALLTFVSQFVTGILLLLYYRPTVKEAHESIQYITAEVSFGWLFRQVHAWGATLMMATVLLHMIRTFFMGSFKKPRELTWIIGVVILIVTMLFGFTGYLLPWNQLSYWATTVGTEVVGAVPWFGEDLKQILLGGPSVGQEALSRFFVFHVAILPWVLVILVTLHLILMRLHNLATLEDVGREKRFPPETGVPFWPVHMAKEACVAAVCFGVLFALSVFSPWEIGEPADPLETPHGIKPEWYFLPTYQLLKYFTGPVGKVVGIGVSGVPFLLLLAWPFIERGPARHPRRRKWAVRLGSAAILLALVFGFLGHISETTVRVFGRTYEIDMYGIPHAMHEPPPSAGQTQPAGEH
ncbi:Cytochrome bc complex cytochrome b subunit [Phycisphaerae bacterium RAS1]|nr:Cytochrome bc complex cytochrome b subunit [Phycisphaerae bacterium RAS1]